MSENGRTPIVFCKGGGCTAKLGPAVLSRVLDRLPPGVQDPDLLVGFSSRDDAAVYRLTDECAVVHTLDFFPPMVEDPYTFGKIAAANALSDIYAMGGTVRTALNIVCFPEKMDLNVLGNILRGGAEIVAEAGGVLAGGHSIADADVKYGLSVTGTVHPEKIWRNNTGRTGDVLVLTKRLGVGIVCTAGRVGEASAEAMDAAIQSMTTLNKTAAEYCAKYDIHACTDVTGFSLLGHLLEVLDGGRLSCTVHASRVPAIPQALDYADEFLLTAAAQRNRNHAGNRVRFDGIPFAMEEVLFDPQTSGGLLIALSPEEAGPLVTDLRAAGLPAAVIGELSEPADVEILVTE